MIRTFKTTCCGAAIGYYGTKLFKSWDVKIDKNGCLLLFDLIVDDQNFVLLNIYNTNKEKELN